jgi:hypothetical protein
MKQNQIFTGLFFAAVLCFAGCVKDDPTIPNQEEVITTLIYTLTPDNGGNAVVLSFRDLDGDGGNAPVITTGILTTNTTYTALLELQNEAAEPTESITDEIEEEAEEHQFFFQTTLNDLEVIYDDQDADGNPIGLTTTVTTGNSDAGTITIILKHEPNKSAAGVINGDITNAGGETDIEVTFGVDVQ